MDRDGTIRRAQGAHADTTRHGAMQELLDHPALGPADKFHPVPGVVASGRGILLDHPGSLATDGHHSGLLRKLGEGNVVVAPLRARGRVLGAMVLVSSRVRYHQSDVALAEVLGRLAGIGVDNARLFAGEQAARRDAERAASRIARLQNVTSALAEALTPREVAEVAIGDTVQASGAAQGAIVLAREDGTLEVLASTGEPAAGERLRPPAGSPIVHALRSGVPVYGPPLGAQAHSVPAALLPLVIHNRSVAVLSLGFADKTGFSNDERTFLEALARQCAHALERAQLFSAEQLARANAESSLAALRESEARYRLLSDNTLDVIARLSADGTTLYVSPACRRVLGVEPDALLGEPFMAGAHPEDVARFGRSPLSHLAASETTTLTYRQRRGDGSYVWLEMTARGVTDAHGRLVEIVAVARDISERKRAEEEMEAGRRQVARSEKLSALGSLVSGVAHEIRTPLAYLTNNIFLIQARLERAARDGDDAKRVLDDVRRMAQEAIEGTDRINLLVRDLGRFTRQPEAGRVAAPLDAVVAEAVRLFRATHRGRVVLESDLQATPPISVDPFQAQQVVLNLLENGSDAIKPGGRLRVSTSAMNGHALLVVADDGPGIPPDVQSRMYDPFFTTKREGTGLGLSIVQRIVETHGGTIRCDSAPGKGTTFTIRFPVPRPPDAR